MNVNENKPSLELVSISKTYGSGENAVEALKNVDLTFRKSEFVSILGPSGCGKTTLLNIVGGLDRYTSGDLIINGVSTKEYKDADWDTYRNNSIGFVFQSYNLIQHQTVLRNVELALTLSGVSKAERIQRAKEVLAKVGLSDQLKKLPNQLSGGQMQRVALARALVNDPDIILADEPTGALDTETSIQIMDLLKEVAKDRLVIMVTHNPDLANQYSTRIINLLDGEKTGDTNPFDCIKEVVVEDAPVEVEQTIDKQEAKPNKKAKKEKKKKSAMKFSTAFALSLSNLKSKFGRTLVTSIAGSIGIIGIALVLAVSTGFTAYIDKLQADTLSVYPVTVSENTIDLEDFQKLMDTTLESDLLKQKVEQKVFSKEGFGKLTNMLKSNKIEEVYDAKGCTYLEYAERYVNEQNEKNKNDAGWKYCLQKQYGFDVNNFIFSEFTFNFSSAENTANRRKAVMSIDALVGVLEDLFNTGMGTATMGISAEFVRSYIPTISQIPNSQELVSSQYEIIDEGGKFPTSHNELLLVVDKYNQLNDITMALLGLNSIEGMTGYNVTFGENTTISFDDIKAKDFFYVNNTDRYLNSNGKFIDKAFTIADIGSGGTLPESAEKLKIVGIARLKEGVEQGVLGTGIAYTSDFVEHVLNDQNNINSPIVTTALANTADSTVEVASAVRSMVNPSAPIRYETQNARQLAGDDTVSKLLIYSVDFDAKEQLKSYLDTWNDGIDTNNPDEAVYEVHYSDSTSMLFAALNSIVSGVEIALICFTSISLVVSSIMIGIITYVSVVERTKEIGILRSVGARKKDISRIFNAETFIIGLCAGLIGVVVTYLLSIPINLIVSGLITGMGKIAMLKFSSAIILVVISFILTLIAGVIPARIAAKKDPVVALRTE